jgi:hypothetical protein
MMMVVKLDRLAPSAGTSRNEWSEGGSNRSSSRVACVRTELRERMVRLITDITITALGKEEVAVRRCIIWDK